MSALPVSLAPVACDVDGSIELETGARVLVQPLRRGDAARVREVFDGLGERSRRARFGGPKPRLSEREVATLSDVDHRDHEALVAIDPESSRAVGIVRFVRDRLDASAAEVAFAIVDAWQAQGLGSRLVDLLTCRARAVGVHRLTASVDLDNVASRSLVRRMGRMIESRVEDGRLELAVAVD